MRFEYPENYSSLPVQRKAHLQFQRHTLRITRDNGFNNTILEAYLNKKDWENAKNLPVCNLVWGPEEILNGTGVDKSLGIYNVQAHVYMDFLLSGEDPSLERASIKADVEKYFLRDYFYTLPERDDGTEPTIHQLMPVSIIPHGDDQAIPRCKLEIEMLVWYRTQMGNPYQRG